MALAVTLLGSATFSTASGTKTVVATPAVGDLIVIVTGHSGNVSAATPTDDNSSGAYTRITSAVAQASVDTLGIFIRNSLIGAANSTTFSHAPGTTTGGGLAVLKVTGMQKVGSAAARASAKQDNQATGGTPTPVLPQAALTTNALIAAVLNATNPAALTQRGTPAWSERADVGYNTPPTGLEVMSINSGETGTSIAWGGTSSSAFGSLVLELDANQALTPSLFTATNTFEAAVVAATYGLTPALASNSASFFAPTVAAGAVSLTASLFTSSATFFAPTIAAGAVALTPSLFNDADTFPAATVLASYGLVTALFTNAGTFHSATVTPGAVALLPSLVIDDDTFPSATVTAGSVDLAPSLVAAANSFNSPTVGGSYGLAPALYADADSFHAAVVTADGGDSAILPGLFANASAFHTAAVTSAVELTAALFTNSPAFPAPTAASIFALSADLFANAAAFHAAAVEPGPVALVPSLFANDNDFAPATIAVTSDVELLAARFDNVVAFRCAYVRQFTGMYPLAGDSPDFPLASGNPDFPLAGRVPDFPLAGRSRGFP